MSIVNNDSVEGIYKLFDCKSKTYGTMITDTSEEALHQFLSALVNTKGSGAINTHPEDFSLFLIGTCFDNKVTSCEPTLVLNCSALVKKIKPKKDLHCKSEKK